MGEVKGVSIEQVREYVQLEGKIEELEARRDEQREKFIAAVLAQGTVSARGTKTTTLRIEKFELVVTRGQHVDVDEKAAAALLRKCGPSVFRKLFRKVVKYVVAKTAAKAIEKSLSTGQLALWAKAVKVTDKKPSLRVAEQKREKEAA